MADPGSSNDYEGGIQDQPTEPAQDWNYYSSGRTQWETPSEAVPTPKWPTGGDQAIPAPPAGGAWWNVPSPPNREYSGVYAGTPDRPKPEITSGSGTTRSGGRAGGGAGGGGPTRPLTFTPLAVPEPYTPEPYTPDKFQYSGGDFELPEYKLPEEDKGYERMKREEYSASGRRALGRAPRL